jgi:hypothetical protein
MGMEHINLISKLLCTVFKQIGISTSLLTQIHYSKYCRISVLFSVANVCDAAQLKDASSFSWNWVPNEQ